MTETALWSLRYLFSPGLLSHHGFFPKAVNAAGCIHLTPHFCKRTQQKVVLRDVGLLNTVVNELAH